MGFIADLLFIAVSQLFIAVRLKRLFVERSKFPEKNMVNSCNLLIEKLCLIKIVYVIVSYLNIYLSIYVLANVQVDT